MSGPGTGRLGRSSFGEGDRRIDAAQLRAAAARRATIDRRQTDALRLVNGEGDGLPGLTVDAFGEVLVASLYVDLTPDAETRWVEAIAEAFSPRALYLKRRPREARVAATVRKEALAPEQPVIGAPIAELVAREHGLAYRIRPGQGLSLGLYLDMREGRAFLRREAAGRRVLNCFSYTCGFGLCALAGGAARAVNLDLSRRVLDWGEENLRLNRLVPERRDFIAGDVFEWLRRLAKKGERFDAVVLDPPSFSTTRSGAFRVERDYPALVEAACAVADPGALVLACCNQASLPRRRFAALIDQGLARAGRTASEVEPVAGGIDFPAPPGQEAPLKVFAVRL